MNEKLNGAPTTPDRQKDDEFEDPDELNELLSESLDPPTKPAHPEEPINPTAAEDKSY